MSQVNHRPNCIVYCRVSTAKSAQEGESLNTQENICRKFVESRGYDIVPNGRVFRETYSGREDERPVLDEVFEYLESNAGAVKYFVFRVIDRFTRGGSYSYERIKKKLAEHGVGMIDTYGVIQPAKNTLESYGFEYEWSRTSPSEVAEIVIANTAKMEVTNILTRLIGREIELTQQGFKMRQAIDGYVNKRIYVEGKKRVIQVADPKRAKFILDMYSMRSAGALTDKEIVERINAQGYRSRSRNRWDRAHENIIGKTGGGCLSVKRFQELIRRPIYCGIICEKWTHWKPVKAQYPGLVSIDTFNAANRGKVFIKEDASGLEILYDYQPEMIRSRRSRENPLFPYKSLVLCPLCHKPFTGSCPRGKSGRYHPTYHCFRSHRYFGVPKHKFETVFESFVKGLSFNSTKFHSMNAVLVDHFERHQNEVVRAANDVKRTIGDLRIEQKMKMDAFIAATSPVLRVSLEKQVEELEERIKTAGGEQQKIGISAEDFVLFREFGKRTLEHLPELLLNPNNTSLRAPLFSLVFSELPTYHELAFGTPKLSWICELSSESSKAKSGYVDLSGLDWNTIEDTLKKWIDVAKRCNFEKTIS